MYSIHKEDINILSLHVGTCILISTSTVYLFVCKVYRIGFINWEWSYSLWDFWGKLNYFLKSLKMRHHVKFRSLEVAAIRTKKAVIVFALFTVSHSMQSAEMLSKSDIKQYQDLFFPGEEVLHLTFSYRMLGTCCISFLISPVYSSSAQAYSSSIQLPQ